MRKKYFAGCVLLDIAAIGLGPANLFWLSCNIPEFVCIIAALIVLAAAVFYIKTGRKGKEKAGKAVVGILAAFAIFLLIAGSYCFGHYHDNRNVNAEEILLYEQIIRIS